MDLLVAVIMGVLQGATEFLPVSSSGHLRLAGAIFGLGEPEILFDIMLHVGTLLSVCAVYRQDLVGIATDLVKSASSAARTRSIREALEPQGTRLALLVIVATIPTGLLGLLLDRLVDGPWIGLEVVGTLLIVNGGILLASRHARQPQQGADTREGVLSLWGINVPRALLLGVVQGIAVLPGISRSGLTITTALFMKVDRDSAARYSFLMSIPAIVGALILKIDLSLFDTANADRLLRFGLGTLVSAVVGYVCLRLLLRMLRGARFHHFAWYCFGAGGLALLLGLGLPLVGT